MKRTALYFFFALSLTALSCFTATQVDTSEETTVYESWQAAYLQGLKIGHSHTRTVETTSGKNKALKTVRTVKLTVKRYGAVMPIKIEQTCVETPDGQVLSMELHQSLGEGNRMSVYAEVNGDKLKVEAGGRKLTVPWDSDCLGLYAQEQAFAKKKAAPGDRFSLLSYELAAHLPLKLNVSVEKEEKTDRLLLRKEAGGSPAIAREETKLLRAVITTDKVKVGGAEVQLPPRTVWLDDKKQVVRDQFEFPGLGVVTQYTATREMVLAEKVNEKLLPDLGLNVMVPLKSTLTNPDETKSVVYRVTLKGDLKPPFLEDARQSIKNKKGKTFDLLVKAVREPGADATAPSPGKEYTEPSSFIDSNDPEINKIAAKAVGGEKSAYKKALLLEKWVHDNMTFSADTGFPPASQIARGLKGDCRQHAMLLAALLRAAGVPSRTALGLVYFRDKGRSPVFAFHMWTEAYIGGKWLSLDAISGKGGIAAAHLKMAQASWSGTETLAPLLPIAQTLGKLDIEIIESR